VLIMKERRHMIPEAIRGMEKPIERALASGACVESGRHLIELTPSGRLHTLPFRGCILNFYWYAKYANLALTKNAK
jgi:hypothetical protein